jgi:N-methylhydantoinase A/oxoprolinase/acetone carboxylase beta subunit
VTDANLLLGRLPAELPGGLVLDRVAAARALGDVEPAAVVEVVDAEMLRALRVVSVERGHDPRDFALVAFGGAGPLHACALADALGMPAIVIPPRAGVLSAVGLLCAARQSDVVRSWPEGRDHTGLDAALRSLADEAASAIGGASEVVVAVDCRYAGQSHEITVPSVEQFAAEHRRRNGYARDDAPIEVVALRASARRRAPVDAGSLPPPGDRRPAVGPCVLAEPDCTVWVADGWVADVDDAGSWVLTRR